MPSPTARVPVSSGCCTSGLDRKWVCLATPALPKITVSVWIVPTQCVFTQLLFCVFVLVKYNVVHFI